VTAWVDCSYSMSLIMLQVQAASCGRDGVVVECVIETTTMKLSGFNADMRASLREALAASSGRTLKVQNASSHQNPNLYIRFTALSR
jgi:hypothetical protein